MSKYGNKHYIQLSLAIFEPPYLDTISNGARSLYVMLKVLENRYCSDTESSFFQTDAQLCDLLKWSKKTLRLYKDELREYPELLKIEARRVKSKQLTFYTIY